MKIFSLLGAVAVAALCSVNPAAAVVYPLLEGFVVEPTATPIGPGFYEAVEPFSGIGPATWQFVLNPGASTYLVAIGGAAVDSVPGDLNMSSATLVLKKLGSPSPTIIETLHFVDTSSLHNGLSWSTTGSVLEHLGMGTYQLVFSGVVKPGGFADHPSFLGAVAITSAPEPSTWAMGLTGFAALGVLARRRRAASLAA